MEVWSTSERHRSLRGRSRATLVGALALLMSGSPVVPAQAVATCAWAGGVVSVSVTGTNATARILVGTGGDDGKILFATGVDTPTPCGAATVVNTDAVSVGGGPERQILRLSIAAGAFAPGATAELTGASEIEFDVDLGEGVDQVVVAGGSDADHFVAGADGVNLNAGEDPDDVDVTVVGIEQLALEGGGGSDTLSGGGGEGTGTAVAWAAISLRGAASRDALIGSAGTDVLNGGEGNDTLDGGDGVDTASYFGAPSGVNVSLAAGTSTGGQGADTLVRIENLTGSSFDDVLTGDDGDNALNGMDGADDLRGLGGSDAARYMLADGGVTVDLAGGAVTGGDGDDTLSDIENALGSAFDDILRGNDGDNHLFGGEGADVLSGRGGRDFLQGGGGDDAIRGAAGNDGLFGQSGDDMLYGGPGNDGLRGGPGTDVLRSGTGDDQLRGGPGMDSCSGGAGRDRARSCET